MVYLTIFQTNNFLNKSCFVDVPRENGTRRDVPPVLFLIWVFVDKTGRSTASQIRAPPSRASSAENIDAQSFSNYFEGGTWGCEKNWWGVLYFGVLWHFYDPTFGTLLRGYMRCLPPLLPPCVHLWLKMRGSSSFVFYNIFMIQLLELFWGGTWGLRYPPLPSLCASMAENDSIIKLVNSTQWKPLNVIALVHTETDNINWMITTTDYYNSDLL